MVKRDVVVNLITGLHARPAANLVKMANKFVCDVTLLHNKNEINAKDIWEVLNGGIENGDGLTVQCNGKDELMALDEICSYISNEEVTQL
ncbi:MAG: HPr family phosphocarrier protein [Bacilli bacterium]|nr:HPr family phosphocarrier protein [Bacilli bacterium]MDD4644213.1 HPr family phosphocarrier protein [Bacilli bacterium]